MRLERAWALPALILLLACGGGGLVLAEGQALGSRLEVWVPDVATTLLESQQSAHVESARALISSDAAWAAAWTLSQGFILPEPARPVVDFSAARVVVVALGSRPTGGYGIRVDSVVRHSSGSAVFLTRSAPSPSCIVIQAFTSPVQIVQIPVVAEPVVFRERERITDC